MGGVNGAADGKRKKTSPSTTPKKTKRARYVSPGNASSGEDKTTIGTFTGPNEVIACTSPPKMKVQSGTFIDSSDESDATVAYNISTTQSTTDTNTAEAPVVAGLGSRSITKAGSTQEAETEKPAVPTTAWFDRTDTLDRVSALGSQPGMSRSSSESSSGHHSTESEVSSQLNADERRQNTRNNWAPTQASGGVPTHHAPAAAVAPLRGPELFDHLAESTLIYQHNRVMFDNSNGPSPPEAQQVRSSVMDSIIHYLGENGGITQENLAGKLARAQAMRVDPRSLPAINLIMAQLTGLPFGPIEGDTVNMAAALADIDLTSSHTSGSRYNAAGDPRRMDSEHGRKGLKVPELQHALRNNPRPEHIQQSDSFRMLVDERVISLTQKPIQQLHEDDIRPADLDEIRRFKADLKPVSDDAKKAVFWIREAGNDEEYRQGRIGIFDKLHHNVPPPLTERVEWFKKNMANAPPLFPAEAENEEMNQLSNSSASLRSRSKKSEMAPVYIMTEDEVQASAFPQARTVPKYEGSNDGQINLPEPDLDQEMTDLTLQTPLIPLNYSSGTPLNEAERLNQFIPFGQTTHINYDEYMHEKMFERIKAAYPSEQWRELPRVDAYGIIKDELEDVGAMSTSDTGSDGGIDDEDQNVSMKDDEDKSMADTSPLIHQEDYNPEQAHADFDRQIELQIELLVKEHVVHDPPERATPLRTDSKKREAAEKRQHMKLRIIQEQRDKVITGLPYVMRSKWTEHETLRDLHRNISVGFTPASIVPKPKAPCDICGRKSHLVKNCKATAPRKGWEPLKSTKPIPNVNSDAEDKAQDQGGPSRIGKRSRAGYLQVLHDHRFDTRGQARAQLGGFDGAVDSPPHIPAHVPKLELNEVEVAEAKQQEHGYFNSISLKGGELSTVRPSRVLSMLDDLPMSNQDLRRGNMLQEMNNSSAYLGSFVADVDLFEEQFAAPAKMTPASSRKPSPSSAERVRMLSKPDGLPPSRPPSIDSSSLRGGDLSASIKEGVTKEQDNMPTFKDDDVEMCGVMEMPFPSLLDGRTAAEREESVGLDDFMDEIHAQLMSEAMNIEGRIEVEQDQAAVNQEVQIAVARQALRVALGGHVAQQLLVQTSIEVSSQVPSPTGDMPMPLPSSQALQTIKMPATLTPSLALSYTSDPIEVAGREAFPLRNTLIASTPIINAAQKPFRISKSSSVPAASVNVIDDYEDDREQDMFTPLDAKIQTGNVAGITEAAMINADGRDEDDNIVNRTEDSDDDYFQPDLDIVIATPKKKKTRKSLTAKAISDVGKIQPKSDAKPKRKTHIWLEAAQTEVPETSHIEAPGDNTKVTTSEKKKSARRKAANTLVLDPVVETQNSASSKPRGRPTRQSTGAAEEASKTPHTAKSGLMKRQAVEARSEKKNLSRKRRRAEAEETEASEVEEQESSKRTKRSSRARSTESGGDAVIEPVETPARKAKGNQTEKRSRTATPRAKSATAELHSNGSDTTLYYDTHEWMLPVEVGDRVVRKLSKGDHRLYNKVDEYDEFTGPWVVLDLKIRKRDKERIAQVLNNNLSEETRSIAWKETLTALVKISIPEEAQTKDKVSPWVELRTLLPVLAVDGVQDGKLGPAYPLLEDFDSYKALKKRLSMTKLKGRSMNVVRKKEARTGDEGAESSLGLVNLRKNVFVAVVDVDPNWRGDDEYEVEKIRKKKLKLVLRSRATDDELDQEDTDKWQEILKHVSNHLNTHPS